MNEFVILSEVGRFAPNAVEGPAVCPGQHESKQPTVGRPPPASYSLELTMEQTCHRCGATVSREDTFCPACGAPQLHFDQSSQDDATGGPENPIFPGRPGQISWRDAISAAVLVAIPAGILCALPLVAAGSLLWVMGGATVAILLYRKKRPMALLSARAGFRIGSLTGLLTAYVTVAATAILRVIQRYPLHLGDTIDHTYEAIISQSMAVFQSNQETQAQVRTVFHFLLSPDGRAASSLLTLISITLTTIFFASIGGYLGVRMFAGRRLA